MANLKDLKTRISSVKSTQKITKAMKMVAASKLRRAQDRAEAARPYSTKMENVLSTLASNVSKENAPELLVGRAQNKTHLVIVITSDRGLCGGLNTSVIKAVRAKAKEVDLAGKSLKVVAVGKKGYEQLKHGLGGLIASYVDTSSRKVPEYEDAESAAHDAIKLFKEGEVDSCSVIYNKFQSAIAQVVTTQNLIPLEIPNKEEKAKDDSVYDYEPEEEKILAELLPLNIAVQIYHAMLENAASEHGSRMTAMDNATRNAGEMIKDLSLVYNRTRQAAITTELTEIVAGAEAL